MGATLIVAGRNLLSPALNDSPVNIQLFREGLSEKVHAIPKGVHLFIPILLTAI